MIIVVAVGAPDQRRAHPGEGFDLIVAGLDLLENTLGGAFGEIGVGIRVIHHLMSRFCQLPDLLRVSIHPLAHQEKGRLYVIFAQDLNVPIRVTHAASKEMDMFFSPSAGWTQ